MPTGSGINMSMHPIITFIYIQLLNFKDKSKVSTYKNIDTLLIYFLSKICDP